MRGSGEWLGVEMGDPVDKKAHGVVDGGEINENLFLNMYYFNLIFMYGICTTI